MIERRRVLRALCGLVVAPIAVLANPHARTEVSVRRHGALGNGSHDDTRAFQDAIHALPAAGGTVVVPAGDYLIDPLRSVRLRSHMHLRLAPGARLLAKPNAAERAYVLLAERVTDVEISGGAIVGERDRHLGRTGEWGHGVMIRGSSRVTVRDLRISRCWGDGMSIGGVKQRGGVSIPSSDVLVSGVVCRGNRRQGLTIGGSRRVRVRDCEFSGTHGTKPEYGIDIEPDSPGFARDVRIERCVMRNNRGGGLQIYKRAFDVTVVDCTIERNGYGIYVLDAQGGLLSGNRIRENGHAGIALRAQTRNFRVRANRLFRNGGLTRSPRHAAAQGQIQVSKETDGIAISANEYGN